MLTPVDLQQKKFQHGMGYTKKDVDSFFDIVVMSYTELYKSNAELTNQVKTLTDSLVHYRTTESKLQKSLMLAEKNAEEATKNANDKAKIIENDAKIKANNIVHQAREELDRIEDSIEGIILVQEVSKSCGGGDTKGFCKCVRIVSFLRVCLHVRNMRF